MRNVASAPRALAATACVAVAALAVGAVAMAQTPEQSQASAEREEAVARIRAQLQERMAEIHQRMERQLAELESVRALELQDLQRELEALHRGGARLRAELEANTTRGALEAAERAMQRVRELPFGMRGMSIVGCDDYGSDVLEHAADLSLDDGQIEQIRSAQRAARRARIERQADIEVAEMDLEGLYEVDEPDLTAIRTKLEEIAMLEVDAQMAGFRLRQDVRGVLNPEQLDELQDRWHERDDVRIFVGGAGVRHIGRTGC